MHQQTPQKVTTSFDFITDEGFRASLTSDYAEMIRCQEAGTWKAVHVLAGSIIEAVLIDYLTAQDLIARDAGLKLDLARAVTLARENNVISERARDLSSVIRGYRNLIHPGRAVRLEDTVSESTARIAESVVAIIVEEISQKRLQRYGYTAEQIATKVENDSSAPAILHHLLRETNPRETERLMFTVLPERYRAALDDPFGPGHRLDSFTQCFRVALENGSTALKVKAAQWLVSLLKEESEEVVFSYGTRFLRAGDLGHVAKVDQTLAKEHLLARLKTDPTTELLDALSGIGAYLTADDVIPFVDPLIRLACSLKPLATRARDALMAEQSATSDEMDKAIIKRLGQWSSMYSERDEAAKAEIVDSVQLHYEIPF